MREYGKVSPQFWIGKTGKSLRGHPEAQIVALYLMTSPHAEMTGIFHCPILYIAHETGLSIEGATKGLARLSEVGFSSFEAETDTVFVHEMAKYQIGDDLKPTDNRVIGVQKLFLNMPSSYIKRAFFERYKKAFLLVEIRSPSKAPLKPRAGAGAEKEQTSAFASFWDVYPKKKSKGQAEAAFDKIKPDDELLQTILKAVEGARESADWLKSEGQFIPHPATWLNARGWEDGDCGVGAKPWERP